MRPICLSERKLKEDGIGWYRTSSSCCYYRRKRARVQPSARELSSNTTRRRRLKNQYALSFLTEFEFSNDTIYFAVAQPYSYTHLQTFLLSLHRDLDAKSHFRREELCRSLAGNRIDLLIITEDCDQQMPKLPPPVVETKIEKKHLSALEELDVSLGLQVEGQTPAVEFIPKFLRKMQDKVDQEAAEKRRQLEALSEEEIRLQRLKTRKPIILLLARSHPWETSSSFVCEGILQFLLSEHPSAVLLRSFFMFYVVPMVNVDGVVNGFSRVDICGRDPDLCYGSDTVKGVDIINEALDSLVLKLTEEDRIAACFCLHAHSTKSGAFFQGFNPSDAVKANWNIGNWPNLKLNPEDILYFFSERSNLVSLSNCVFHQSSISTSTSASSNSEIKGSQLQDSTGRNIETTDYRTVLSNMCKIPSAISLDVSMFSHHNQRANHTSLESQDFIR